MPRILSGRVVAYLLILLVFDLSLVPAIRIQMVQPILLYLMVLHTAFQWGIQKAVPMAIVIGLLRDFSGSQFFGIETASLIIASTVLNVIVQKIDRESAVTRIAVSFVFVFSVLMLSGLFPALVGAPVALTLHTFLISAAVACYTSVLTPIFSTVTSRWFRERAPMKQYELFR